MSNTSRPAVLLIGGLDPQGCSGIVADIQTTSAHGCHGVPLLTCLTEQTSQGLTSIGALSEDVFMRQYQSCVADFDIAAIKIGLISNINIAYCISKIIDQHDVPVVLDPVLSSSSGGITLKHNVNIRRFIIKNLLVKITLLTPNLSELAILTKSGNISIHNIRAATAQLISKGLAVCLVTGGHANSKWSADYLNTHNSSFFYFYHQKLGKDVRGTGCVLASSIASNLAFHHDIRDAVMLAKAYVNQGIKKIYSMGCHTLLKHAMVKIELKDLPKLCYDHNLIGSQFNFPLCQKRLGIYPIVDSSDWIKRLVQENISTIQLRIKDILDDQLRREEIRKAVSYCDKSIALFVNDHWQLAIEENAYGVHLGQKDLHDANLSAIVRAGLRLGISVHSYWELARALAINPSYISLGPLFNTTSKKMSFVSQEIGQIKTWIGLLGGRYPLVAIGGIDRHRAEVLNKMGIGSVAMISAITKADDYKKTIRDLVSDWR
ncbi:MAG: bifunctional hydroxymethylpyrimidine kinase/phosphomethylpyrimidine kinase [Piscirickettsiaceae bacterium]|nr:bifunctional hydroxymethylpyrimidine kinase/phosphomethylpyrimidine kinase [Piscirickettsiaceae bacterium]